MRDILKRTSVEAYDGEALQSEWTLNTLQLRRAELKFDRGAGAFQRGDG